MKGLRAIIFAAAALALCAVIWLGFLGGPEDEVVDTIVRDGDTAVMRSPDAPVSTPPGFEPPASDESSGVETASVAASGRTRLPAESAPSSAGADRLAAAQPSDVQRGEGEPAGDGLSGDDLGEAIVLNAPPSADAAALEFDPGAAGKGPQTNSTAPESPQLSASPGSLGDARRSLEAAVAGLNSGLGGSGSDAVQPGAPRSPDAPEGPNVASLSSDADTRRPRFDVVRVAPDGSAVLAGRAEPGAEVTVMIDGAPSETVEADNSGEFVALVGAPTSPSKGGARRIDLSAKNTDGKVLDSSAPIVVAAPASPEETPVAVRPSAEGVEILQPAARRGDDRVTIDSVSYGEQGEVLVSGRGKPGETARLYLDNALQAEARVSPDGDWRLRITKEVAPARYSLRVDQMSASGVVSSRAETPFERAEPADIRISDGAVIVQPGNNLWRIASYVYGDGTRYTVIYGQNRTQIRDPDLIYPGQVLSLPGVETR